MTELITRLRAAAKVALNHELLTAAADALEAAQAEAANNQLMCERSDELLANAEADRDAEAALADQLAEALTEEADYCERRNGWPHSYRTTPALFAHRERRTTPTKDGER